MAGERDGADERIARLERLISEYNATKNRQLLEQARDRATDEVADRRSQEPDAEHLTRDPGRSELGHRRQCDLGSVIGRHG